MHCSTYTPLTPRTVLHPTHQLVQAQDEDEDGAEMNAQGIAHRFAVHECVKIERQYKLWCMDPAATSSVVQLRAGYSIDLGQMVSSAEVPIGRKDYVVESAQVGSATNTDNDVADVAEPPPEFFEVNGRTVRYLLYTFDAAED